MGAKPKTKAARPKAPIAWFALDKGTRLHVLCQLASVLRQTSPRSSQRHAWCALVDLAMRDEGNSDDVTDRINPDDIQRCKLGDVIDTDDWEPRP